MILKMQNGLSLIDRAYLVFLVLAVYLVWSCSDVQKRTEPEHLLSQEEMTEIYTDMLMLDAVYRTNPKKFESYQLEPTAHIYNKFDIDSLTLAQNMSYYNLDFEANSEIYEQVRKNIERKKQLIDSLDNIKDSLRREKRKLQKTKIKDSVALQKDLIKADKK
jgi:hypothetical protein